MAIPPLLISISAMRRRAPAVSPTVGASTAVLAPTQAVAFTSPPTTGTVGTALSLAGTVAPSGTAVQVALGTSATTAPASGWIAATVSGTGWTAALTPSAAGTFYIWAQQTADTAVDAVSATVTIAAAPTLAITSPPTTGTVGTALSLAGTVAPSGTAVQVALGTSATTAPTSGWIAATVSGTGWTAALTPSAAGTFYIWAQQTTDTAVTAVSSAVTVAASSGNASILTQSGATTWGAPVAAPPSTFSRTANNSSPFALEMPISPTQASGATVTGYWTTTQPSTEPSAGALTGGVPPVFYEGNVSAYVASPSATGTWYLSLWIDNNGSNNGHVILTPFTVTA